MVTYLMKNIPEDLHRDFKTAAAKKGKDMKKIILEFMEDFIKKSK